MGRHKKSVNRPIVPDVKYNSPVVTKFVSRMMLDGKKDACTKIVYKAMDQLKAKTDKDPLEVFLKALDNVKPMVEVKSRRVGGATYQVPCEIRDARKEALAMRWVIAWQRQTKLLLTTAGRMCYVGLFLPGILTKLSVIRELFFV